MGPQRPLRNITPPDEALQTTAASPWVIQRSEGMLSVFGLPAAVSLLGIGTREQVGSLRRSDSSGNHRRPTQRYLNSQLTRPATRTG